MGEVVSRGINNKIVIKFLLIERRIQRDMIGTISWCPRWSVLHCFTVDFEGVEIFNKIRSYHWFVVLFWVRSQYLGWNRDNIGNGDRKRRG